MKKTKKIVAMLTFVVATTTGCLAYAAYNHASIADANCMLQTNLEALTNAEFSDHTGWMWEKVWMNCTTGSTVLITSSGGQFEAGAVIKLTTKISSELAASSASYTVIQGGQPGLKSYCPDGWKFCVSNECR